LLPQLLLVASLLAGTVSQRLTPAPETRGRQKWPKRQRVVPPPFTAPAVPGLGYGDIKYLAALGAWHGWQLLPQLLLVASLLAGNIASKAQPNTDSRLSPPRRHHEAGAAPDKDKKVNRL
jgi:prepilin signal peptidase PulO-like enzyme (type II secretory pathway)